MKNCLKILFLFSLFVLAACNRTPEGEISWQPNNLNLKPPPGPPEYQKGWSDGCESGANAYASSLYKVFKAFEFRYDASLRKDKIYSQVWKDAFLYCSIFWERTQEENI